MNDPAQLGDFTAQADAYGRARPDYPSELLDRLLARCAVAGDDTVLELGAGTGLFTQSLAQRGLRVVATEPNDAMRSRAPELDGVTWSAGTFEATGLEDARARWVVAAQAFHWATPDRALPEIRRVLQPGGHFTVLWNDRRNEDSEVLSWTRAAIHAVVPGFDEKYRAVDWGSVLTNAGDFEDAHADEVLHVVRMSTERYLDLWRSHNHLSVAAGADALAQLVAAIDKRLWRENRTFVDVPYACRAWTVRRRDERHDPRDLTRSTS